MTTPHDAIERAALCDLLDEVGPDAPTLAGDWTTGDLAVHLVVRERNPLAAPGIFVDTLLSRVTDWAMARELARPYPDIVDRVRSGPPIVPWRLPIVRELLNLNEFFVHHEDVRRAAGRPPRTDVPDLDHALRRVVSRMAGIQLWRRDLDVELVDETGAVLARRGDAPPRIVARPGELLLWLNGRGDAADLTFEGDEDAVASLWDADLAI